MYSRHSAAAAAALREAERDRLEAAREAEEDRREAEEDRLEAERDRAEALREAEQDRREAERDRAEALREAEQDRREAERDRAEALREAERDRVEVLSGATSYGRTDTSYWRLSGIQTSRMGNLITEGSMIFGPDEISPDRLIYRLEHNGDKTLVSVFVDRDEGHDRTHESHDSQSDVGPPSQDVAIDESDAETSAGQLTPDASDDEEVDSKLFETGSEQGRSKPYQATVEDASDRE